jgi:hypothetical protein
MISCLRPNATDALNKRNIGRLLYLLWLRKTFRCFATPAILAGATRDAMW